MSFSMYSSNTSLFLRLFQHPQRDINTHTIGTRINKRTDRKSSHSLNQEFVQTLYLFHNALEQIRYQFGHVIGQIFLEVFIKFFGILIKELPNNFQISCLLLFSRKNADSFVWLQDGLNPNPVPCDMPSKAFHILVGRSIYSPLHDDILVFPVPEKSPVCKNQMPFEFFPLPNSTLLDDHMPGDNLSILMARCNNGMGEESMSDTSKSDLR